MKHAQTLVSSRRLSRLAHGLFGFIVLIAGWALVARSGAFSDVLVPTPLQVVEAFQEMWKSGELQDGLRASTQRVLMGVVIGVSLAIPVGILLGWYWRFHATVDPLLNFFRALPPIALIPLVIVYLGIEESARVFLLSWASFFVSVIVIYEGIVAIDPVYVRAGLVLGATQREILRKIVLPLTVPMILVAVRIAVAVSWGTVVAAELIAAQTGLGASISNAANFLQISKIYVGIITIGVMALTMDRIARALLIRLVRWQERVER